MSATQVPPSEGGPGWWELIGMSIEDEGGRSPEAAARLRQEWNDWARRWRPTVDELNALIAWAIGEKDKEIRRLTARL